MRRRWSLTAILLVLLIPVLIGGTSWAEESDNNYTLNRAISKALDPENPSIEELEVKVSNSDNSLSSAQMAESSVNRSAYPEEWYAKYSTARIAQANLTIARRSREMSKNQMTIQVKQAYFNAVLAQEQTKLVKQKYSKAQELYKIAKSRYDRKLSTKKDFLMAQISLASSELSRAESVHQQELAFLNLRTLLNIDYDQDLVLTDKLTYEPMADLNPKTVAYEIAKNSSSIFQAETMIEAYKDIKEQATSISNANLTSTTTYYNAHKQVENYQNQKELNLKDIQLNVYKTYINLKSSETKLKNLNKQIELAEEVARIANLSYRAGTSTLLEANDALINLEDTKLGYQQSLHSYNTAKASFEAGIF